MINSIYHGSLAAGLSVIEPRPSRSFGNQDLVFGTPVWFVALVMGTGWTDEDMHFGFHNYPRHTMYLSECYPGAFDKFFHQPTSIYSLDYDRGHWIHDYYTMWSQEFSSRIPQKVIKEVRVVDPWPIIVSNVPCIIHYGRSF